MPKSIVLVLTLTLASKPTSGAGGSVLMTWPKSAKRYSARPSQLLQSAASTPPPMVQPDLSEDVEPLTAEPTPQNDRVPAPPSQREFVLICCQAGPPVAYNNQLEFGRTPMRPRMLPSQPSFAVMKSCPGTVKGSPGNGLCVLLLSLQAMSASRPASINGAISQL